MESLEKNRVFDRASLEEILEMGSTLMRTAIEVSESLKTSLSELEGICDSVPGEAKEPDLKTKVSQVKSELKTEEFADFLSDLQKVIGKLLDEIPVYDKQAAGQVEEIEGVIEGVRGVISDLKTFLKEEALSLSYEDFTKKLKDYQEKWEETVLSLDEKLLAASTFLKGIESYAGVYSKDPVNLITGNFIYEKEDLSTGGSHPLVFVRFYNAMDRKKGSLGRNWVHNYEMNIRQKDGEIMLTKSDGAECVFLKKESGEYESKQLPYCKIRRKNEEYCYFEVMENQEDIKYFFEKEGRLKRVERGQAGNIIFEYEKERLIKAENQNGDTLSYFYEENGKLCEVCDQQGRRVRLSYQDGRLAEVFDAMGESICYSYAANGRLEEIKNKEGKLAVKNEYDEHRRVIRQIFADGGEMTYGYDDKANVVSLTEQNGNQIRYVHDKKLRHIQTEYTDSKECYTYQENNRKTSYKDRNGNLTFYGYDERGNVNTIKDALGNTITIAYDKQNHVTQLEQNGETILGNEYDQVGRLTRTEYVGGGNYYFQYKEQNTPSRVILPDESSLSLEYDHTGNLIFIETPDGEQQTFRYDEWNRIIESKNNNGNTMYYSYDKCNRLLSMEDSFYGKRTYQYTKSGKIKCITDFDGQSVYKEYNAMNKVESILDKRGNRIRYEYDTMWNLTKEIRSNGLETQYCYNKQNRLETVIQNGIILETYEYDYNGNRTKIVNAKEGETLFTYDALNRIKSVIENTGNTIHFSYDSYGNVIQIRDCIGIQYEAVYEKGRKNKETDFYGNTVHYIYNKAAMLQKKVIIMNGEEKSISYAYYPGGTLKEERKDDQSKKEYDVKGNLIKVVDALGNEINYNYNKQNQLLEILQGEERTTSYERKSFGRIESIKEGDNRESYEYNLLGDLLAKTDREGNRIQYYYEKTGEIEKIVYGDGNVVTFSYNRQGQVEKIEDNLGITSIQHDNYGRIIGVTDYKGETIGYEWNNKNQKISISYPNESKVTYQYDEMGNISHIGYGTMQVTYCYDKQNRLIEKRSNCGNQSKYSYDEKGRLQRLVHKRKEEIIATYQYWYNQEGNKSKIEKQRKDTPSDNGVYEYSYDALNRLQEVRKEGMLLYRYEYDAFHNRIRMEEEGKITTYHYDTRNRLVQKIEETNEGTVVKGYEYDNRGNLIRENGKDGSKIYTYDARNLLEKIEEETGESISYVYNGLGHRVLSIKSKEGKEEERNEYSNDITRSYQNLLLKRTGKQVQTYVWQEELLGVFEEDEPYYSCNDELGSPLCMIDSRGEIRESYAYGPFGEGKEERTFQPFGYTGYQREGDYLYYANARYYDRENGRFVSEDSERYIKISMPITFNKYLYCQNNPIRYIDFRGFDVEDVPRSAQEIMIQAEFDNYFSDSNIYGYVVDGTDITQQIITNSIVKSLKNTPRPKNIGKGIWNKTVVSYTDDVLKFQKVSGKLINKLGYVGVAVDVGIGIKENIDEGASWQETTSDAVVDTVFSGGTLLASVASGAAIGNAVGTFVPGIGNLVGTIAGTVVGLGVFFLTDVLQVNDKSIREHTKDEVIESLNLK